MSSAGDLVEAQNITMDNVKSSLYCVKCNNILRDAVEVSCCHSLYCNTCIDPSPIGKACFNCGREILSDVKPNFPVRRLVATIPVPCVNEGCKEIVAAGAMHDHITKICDYTKVSCRFDSRGCAATMLRKEAPEHERLYCIFRDLLCPQGCGISMQWRECHEHFLHQCPRTLVDCAVKCGALVERQSLFQHMNDCPMKPMPCPYRSIGCTMKEAVRKPDLEAHMNISIHAHLQLLDAKVKQLERLAQQTAISVLRPPSHDWDVGSVRCVGRWEAQSSSIYAIAIVDGYIVTGSENGDLMVFHPFSGDIVRTVASGDQPIRSLLGLGDGRLAVGRKFHSILLYGFQCSELIASATLHPKEVTHSKGIFQMAKGNLNKRAHLADKPHLHHAELYAVPLGPEDVIEGEFEAIFATTEHHIRVLDAATLEEVEHIKGHHDVVTSCVVHQDTYLCSGGQDGAVRIHDMRTKHFPQLYWLQCFGGPQGVRSMCFHPNAAQWRNASHRPGASTDENAPVVLCLGGSDGSVGFWDFKEKVSCDLVVSGGHKGEVLCATPVDGSLIVTGGADEYWRAWNGKAETSHADIPGSTYCAVAKDNMLFAAGSQGCVRLWTATTLRFNEKRQAEQKKPTPL